MKYIPALGAIACLLLGLTLNAAKPAKNAAKNQAAKPANKAKDKENAPADRLFAARLSAEEGYHTAPSAAETKDGVVHVAWVQYVEGNGDQVVVRDQLRGAKSHLTNATVLTSEPGQFIRPVIAASGDQLWCLWTQTQEENRSAIWFAHFTDGKWSKAARLLAGEQPNQNPEIAASADGKVAIVYQFHNGKDYDIHLQRWEGEKWGEAKTLTDNSTNDWDPAAAFDAKGKLTVAYSGFSDGDYDVFVAQPDDANTKPRRISARGEYDMHPWLAAAPDGSVWLSWDVVRIKNHGFSGGTTITGANKQRDKADTDEGNVNHWAGIEVRVLDGENVRVPGSPREQIVAPQGYMIAHRGLGKIAVSSNGEPWIVYRALMRPISAWSPNVRDGYLWELQARPFRDGAWQDAVVFNESDGYLEEAALASSASGIKVAYTTEHRHSSARNVSYVTKKEDAPPIDATTRPAEVAYNHHHDFDGYVGWHGDVYLTSLPNLMPAPIDLAKLPIEQKPEDRKVDPRIPRNAADYSVKAGEKNYQLLFGDLHRHSNISRCSVGNEPNPDDLYRYGIDIDMYDFLALSDHSEYTTDYYWWRQQKVADLYNIPGAISMLYNSEWSMPFPQGHTNTVFATRRNWKMNGKIGATANLMGGWEFLRRGEYKAITIPHTPADPGMGTKWPSYDPGYMRLVEIFQACRGSYEYEGCPRQHGQATNKAGFYWKALEKGYRVGIICSSDHGYGAAYACVYAPENTREAVWQALYDRRTYGSTTYGLVLDVRSGSHWMGEEFSSTSPPSIDVFVRGSVPIRSVEIIGRSKILHTEGSIEKPLNTAEHRLNWTDPEWSQLKGEQWYYVRVIQSDDEMAWSSPMWVTKK